MKTKGIKTKRALQQVASDIVRKIRSSMSWNEDAIIDVRDKGDSIEIETSQNCPFMTSTFLSCMVEVANEYKAKYPANVCYGIDTGEFYFNIVHEYIQKPLFKILINKTNKLKNDTIMKASKKMEATIARMEKKYGKLNRDYFVEVREENRVGRGFYDGCTLTCDILKNLHIVVAHDGTYYTL